MCILYNVILIKHEGMHGVVYHFCTATSARLIPYSLKFLSLKCFADFTDWSMATSFLMTKHNTLGQTRYNKKLKLPQAEAIIITVH